MPDGARTTARICEKADRLTNAGGVTYTFDASGNLTARGADSFTFDQANRLKSATISGTVSTYVYDGDGKRTRKTVGANPAVNYVYDVNQSLPVVLVYHTDGLGSVRALTDGSGNVVQTYETDEFGISTLTSGSSTQPFQYTGEQRDAETGFVYLRARYYDPSVGRFIGADQVRGIADLPQSLDRYPYATNNPATMTDPSGRIPPLLAVVLVSAGGGMIASGLAYTLISQQTQTFNWGELGIAMAAGAAGGALMPGWGTSVGGATLIGAGTNLVQYGGTQMYRRQPMTPGGVVVSLGSGAAGGWAGGAFPRRVVREATALERSPVWTHYLSDLLQIQAWILLGIGIFVGVTGLNRDHLPEVLLAMMVVAFFHHGVVGVHRVRAQLRRSQ